VRNDWSCESFANVTELTADTNNSTATIQIWIT
jgi:hypothetical protein